MAENLFEEILHEEIKTNENFQVYLLEKIKVSVFIWFILVECQIPGKSAWPSLFGSHT
jgi:hypothetical protein